MRDRKIRELVRLAAPKYVREAEAARKTAVYESEPERQPVRGWVGGLCAVALTAFAVFAGLWFYPTEPGITANNSGLLSEIERATLPPGTEVTQTEQTTESLTTPTSETLTTPTTESQTTPTTESQTTPTTESQTTPTSESQTTPPSESQTTLSTAATSDTPATSETAAPQLMLGDVNGDGKIDTLDANLICGEVIRILHGEEGTFTPEQIAAADVVKLDLPWSDALKWEWIEKGGWGNSESEYSGYLFDYPEEYSLWIEDAWAISEAFLRNEILAPGIEKLVPDIAKEMEDKYNNMGSLPECYCVVREPDAEAETFTHNGYTVPNHWYGDPDAYIVRCATGAYMTFYYGYVDEDGFYHEKYKLYVMSEQGMRSREEHDAESGTNQPFFPDGYEAAYAEAVSQHGYFIPPATGERSYIDRLYYLTESNLLIQIELDKKYWATSEKLDPIKQSYREFFS